MNSPDEKGARPLGKSTRRTMHEPGGSVAVSAPGVQSNLLREDLSLTPEQYAADRAFVAELRSTFARIGRPFPVFAMATSPKDVTARFSAMPRNSALLYRNTTPKNIDPPAYKGLLRMADGTDYWALVWPRIVKDKQVVELKLIEKDPNPLNS